MGERWQKKEKETKRKKKEEKRIREWGGGEAKK